MAYLERINRIQPVKNITIDLRAVSKAVLKTILGILASYYPFKHQNPRANFIDS